jgi:integrase
MNVYRRDKGGPYWYRFMFKGQRIQKSSGVYNKADAMDIASAYRTQLAKGEVGIKEPEPALEIPRFSAAMKTFLEWSEQEYAGNASHKRYITSSKALLAFFGNKPIDKITSDDVEQFKTVRAQQKKAPAGKKSKHRKARAASAQIKPATVNRELTLLHHLFTRFETLVPLNPCRKVKKLDEDNQQDRVLSPDEERIYLMAASQPLKDIAVLMLQTGARPEEVCRIRRENVFLDAGYVLVPFGKTRAARRKLWLNGAASNVIARRLEAAKGEYLFPGRGKEDKPLVKVNAAHASALRRSKVKRFRPYDLRHTFATRAVQAGVDLVTLKDMLGHSKINMVLRYAHPGEQHQAAAMRKMEAAGAR